MQDAEDVAAQTFEAILKNQLLARWESNRSARLRTLLCQVVRNVLANRARQLETRERRLREYTEQTAGDGPLVVHESSDPAVIEDDTFYVAWIEALLTKCIDCLMTDLHSRGKGDHFRVLYGRLCEGLSTPDVSQALDIKMTAAENYFKSTKKRLADLLKLTVREHVERYTDEHEADDEFRREWATLGDYLQKNGGLELTVRRVYQESATS